MLFTPETILLTVSSNLLFQFFFCSGIPNYDFEKGKITFKRNLNKTNNSQVQEIMGNPCTLHLLHQQAAL